MNINDMSQGINEKFDELNLYKTVIMELVNCGEIALVRKIMRMNFELTSKIDIKLLNKKVKESGYRFTTRNGKIVLVKNSYVRVDQEDLEDHHRHQEVQECVARHHHDDMMIVQFANFNKSIY